MWYAFCGSVLASEGAFEGKMEELCRELGDRGHLLACTANCSQSASGLVDLAALSQSLLINDNDARTVLVQESLDAAVLALHVLGRKTNKPLMPRLEVLMDDLVGDEGSVPAWVDAEWTFEGAEAVARAMAQVRELQGASAQVLRREAMGTVTALLEAIEGVVASHVDVVEALQAALRGSGDGDAIVTVLEHGLKVLEAVSLSSPRKVRKELDSVCEHVEVLLESLGELVAALSACPAPGQERVVEVLCCVSRLRVSEAGPECAEVVSAALEELERFSRV